MASPLQPLHGQHQSLVSDYDSDAQYLSDMVPLARPAAHTTEELNLRVVSRYRQDTLSLEHVVPIVQVYRFSMETKEWEKSGMEGPLFLCALAPSKEYGYRCAAVLLNRRGLDNLNIELVKSEQVEVIDGFVIVHQKEAGKTGTYGLWVFSEGLSSSTENCPAEFAAKIRECVQKAESSKQNQDITKSNGHLQKEESAPMGRQISLRELFGQQRQEDGSFSVRSHSPSRRTSAAVPAQSLKPEHVHTITTPKFRNSADTDFFRSAAPATSHPTSPLPPQSASNPINQQQSLLALFRQASEQPHL